MSIDPKLVREIFLAAADYTEPERVAYLASQCGSNRQLLAAVERLLAAHDLTANPVDQVVPARAEPTRTHVQGEQPNTVIGGRYKLLEALGEGGMGTVWVAEQTDPVRRKVALKLIKVGMDSRSVLARFEAERQALALMDHPHIAKVLDGGLTEAGRPYFVMEYFKGVPITEYCDAARLSVSERLTLFVQVCQAVQHAHQKGIIHRDLKPSNILVAPYDDKPVPKVIDFGLAKAMHATLTEQTLHTPHGTVLGTPLYMSPEQAQLNNLDIDTRADIYSLGVLLYELLTGTTPLERQRFKEAAWDEVRRLIREDDPPSPSARLSSTETLPSVAACRQVEPTQLTRQVRGELDWIVMKSLDKDRTRRYETANGFALDVQRFLAGEPVVAAPPRASYRLKKFARKHRAILTTAAIIVLLLAAGVATSSWQAARAIKAEAVARQAEHDARLAQHAEAAQAESERQAKQAAERRLAQVEKANEILGSIFENLDPKEIEKSREPLQALLVTHLDRAIAQLDAEAIGDPLVVAKMQNKLGLSLVALGAPHKAIPLFEKELATCRAQLGREHPDALSAMNNLATALFAVGKREQALQLLEETRRLWERFPGSTPPKSVFSRMNLARAYTETGRPDLALPLLTKLLEFSQTINGSTHPFTLEVTDALATTYLAAGQHQSALPLLEDALRLKTEVHGPDATDTLAGMNNLAAAYRDAGQRHEALQLLEQALPRMRAVLGSRHPDTLMCVNNLASMYWTDGQHERALPFQEDALKLMKEQLGADHPDTLASMNNLATIYQEQGKLDLALPLCEEALLRMKLKHGPDHPHTLAAMNNIATIYRDLHNLDKAIPILRDALQRCKEHLGPTHQGTLMTMANLAEALVAAEDLGEAIPLAELTLGLRKEHLGISHPDTLVSMNNLAGAYSAAGKPELALPLWEQLLERYRSISRLDRPDGLAVVSNYALTLTVMDRTNDATEILVQHLPSVTMTYPANHPFVALYFEQLADCYRTSRQLQLAIPLLAEALDRSKSIHGKDARNTLRLMGKLAAVHSAAGQQADALALLDEHWKLGRSRWGDDDPETLQALNNLASGFKDSGKLEHALPLYDESLTRRLKVFGPDDPRTLVAMQNLALACVAMGKLKRAVPLFEETLNRRTTQLGPDHPDTLMSKFHLGNAYQTAGKLPQATELLEDAVERLKDQLGADHVDTLSAMYGLSSCYLSAGRFEQALPLLQELTTRREKTLGPLDPATVRAASALAIAYWRNKQVDKAIALFEGLLQRLDGTPERNAVGTQFVAYNLGLVYLDAQQYAEAVPVLERVYQSPQSSTNFRALVQYLLQAYVKANQSDKARDLAQKLLAQARANVQPNGEPAAALAQLGHELLQATLFSEAEGVLRECLSIREQQQPEHWLTFNTQSMLGAALFAQKNYVAAEPLLLAGYQGMKQRETTIPEPGRPRLTEALQRLVDFYTAVEKLDEVKKWQAELEQRQAAVTPK